ncbi:MAG: transporter related protein [Collimonas fungivorans]|uniref:ABC transporter ATP-binding protein n=1 Tax=Collimonas fungivorans TaxID=158899 RepID=UPI0026EBDA75|nr:ABC transporter ATP-binding protein [Collimonas fungivorans]MDB5769375.1 transporter related protein [Collimonas fungivorans]
MTELLSIRIARKDFGAQAVLANLNLDIGLGQVVSLVGASGCGKSTLLRIVAGLEREYRGEVRLAGRNVDGVSREIGFIFQEPRLLPWLTVAQNVAFDIGRQSGVDPRAAELIKRVGLDGFAQALPKSLSGGMAQRTAIARGLFSKPQLLLLDEPFSAVDAFTRMKLQDLLLDIARENGTTLLLVTHDIDEAIYLSDRVVILDSRPGTIAADISIETGNVRDRRSPELSAYRKIVLDALETIHAI